MDHGRVGPPGLGGGEDGAANEVIVEGRQGEYRSPHWSKDEDIHLTVGDAVQVRTPGGGGYGDPFSRPPATVRRDVERGYYTAEEARRRFGVVLAGELPVVDEAATARLRGDRRRGA
jgi:N-methylhydantoinase B